MKGRNWQNTGTMFLLSGEHFEKMRYVVQMKQITYPDGKKCTRSFIPFDVEGRGHTPNSDIINVLLPKIDDEYRLLVEKCRDKGIPESLDRFFENVADLAVVGEGLKEMLALDIDTNVAAIEKALMETQWFKSAIEYIHKESRKAKKIDPIKYAESVRQISDIFGPAKTMYLFSKSKIALRKSAIVALRRIANETPKIKTLIKEGKLKLTIAFELPNVEEGKREKIAQKIATARSYERQRRLLRKMHI